MTTTSARMNRGDIVRYWFDTGAMGVQPLSGVVESAGTKTYTVRWESGIRNRLRQGRSDVTLESDPEMLAEARARFGLAPPAPPAAPSPPMARKRIRLDIDRPVASFREEAGLTAYALGRPLRTKESAAAAATQSMERSAGNVQLNVLRRALEAQGYDLELTAVRREE